MPEMKVIKEFVRTSGLSEAQLDVLRRASRKYEDFHHNKDKLYNGEVNTYGVMSVTIAILRERGLIVQGHRICDEGERQKMSDHADGLISEAWEMVRKNADPLAKIAVEEGNVVVWRDVHGTLSVAKSIHGKLAETCMLITEKGRRIAAEWKKTIGAVEE